MGLFGTIAKHSAGFAVRGAGRLVGVVLPDSITPWNLRKTASRTSSSILRWGMREMKSRAKRKDKESRAAQPRPARPTLTQQARASASWKPAYLESGRPPAARPSRSRSARVMPAGRHDEQMSPAMLVLMSGPPSVRRRNSPAGAGAAAASSKSVTIRPAVPNERFDKNRWARGGGLVSKGGFDDVRPATSIVRGARRDRSRKRSQQRKYRGL